MIGGGFASKGETSNAREIYATHISGTTNAGKKPKRGDEMVISFTDAEIGHATCTRENVLVITVKIDVFDVKRVLIDSRCSLDLLLIDALKNMGSSEKDLQMVNFSVLGFASTMTYPIRSITFPVLLGEVWKSLSLTIITIIVVHTSNSYNTMVSI